MKWDSSSAVLCGNSLGGQVALDFYLRHPERVERLVLSGSAGLFERNLSGGQHPRLCRNFIREQACGIFYDDAHVSEELVDDVYAMLSDRHYRRFLLKVAKATRDRYMLEELAKVKVPTLIVWGRDDAITPPFVAQQFCDHIAERGIGLPRSVRARAAHRATRRVCSRAARIPRRHDVGRGLPGQEAAVRRQASGDRLQATFVRPSDIVALLDSCVFQ